MTSVFKELLFSPGEKQATNVIIHLGISVVFELTLNLHLLTLNLAKEQKQCRLNVTQSPQCFIQELMRIIGDCDERGPLLTHDAVSVLVNPP